MSDQTQHYYYGIALVNNRLQFAAAKPGSLPCNLSYDTAGIDYIREQLSDGNNNIVITEASPRLPLWAVADLILAKIPLVVVDPSQVSGMEEIQATAQKTSDSPAKTLAVLGALAYVQAPVAEDSLSAQISAITERQRQVRDMLMSERRRLNTNAPFIHQEVQQHIAWLQHRAIHGSNEIRRSLENSSLWRTQDQLLVTVMETIRSVAEQISTAA